MATYCVGLAASGGAVLLAGGAKGKRFALQHAKVMIHQPHGGVGGQVSDIEIQANEILRTRAALNEILAQHTGQTVEEIAKATDRDYYMTRRRGQGVRHRRRHPAQAAGRTRTRKKMTNDGLTNDELNRRFEFAI